MGISIVFGEYFKKYIGISISSIGTSLHTVARIKHICIKVELKYLKLIYCNLYADCRFFIIH